MCLGVPGKVIAWIDRDATFGRALVEFAGVRRECHMACVPDAEVGDYVVVHAGIAICRLNELEAERTLQDLDSIALSNEEFGDSANDTSAVVDPFTDHRTPGKLSADVSDSQVSER